jgi:hypothetical protein
MKNFVLCLLCFGSFRFVENSNEVYSDLRSQFESLKSENEIYSSKTLALAAKVKAAMEGSGNSEETLSLYNDFKKDLPTSVRILIWGENTHIYNRQYSKEYMYAVYDGGSYDSQRRIVFMWTPGGRHSQGQWEFSTENNGETFLIKSLEYQEYLYAAADSYAYDSSRRRVFTWRSDTCNGCEWYVEIVSDNEIRLKFKTFDEYLYGGEDSTWQNSERRNIFTWRPNRNCDDTCVWRLSPESEG